MNLEFLLVVDAENELQFWLKVSKVISFMLIGHTNGFYVISQFLVLQPHVLKAKCAQNSQNLIKLKLHESKVSTTKVI